MEIKEKFLRDSIAQSQVKQTLMELGLRYKLSTEFDKISFAYIKYCIELINSEKSFCELNQKELDEFLKTNSKREIAKEKLGIGGNND